MKNNFCILLVGALVFFTSCGPNKKNTATTTAPATPANAVLAPASDINSTPIVTPQSQSGTPATAVALNPAHGMPNHRCDIAVGAPLNSAPTINVSPAPRLTTPALPLPTQGTYAAGTNPPHGQPGHDCSIAVGAPLRQ